MDKNTIPYLCGGTFLTQVLRARKHLLSATEYQNGQKENLSEQETFRRLISIFHLNDIGEYRGNTLKTNTSKFKRCIESVLVFTHFGNANLRERFDEDVRSPHSKALCMMIDFVNEFIDEYKFLQLTQCMIDLVLKDTTISNDTIFYIFSNGKPITKQEISSIDTYELDALLLGIWHFILLTRASSNETGSATYQSWFPSPRNYAGTIGTGFNRKLSVNRSIRIEQVEAEIVEPIQSETTSNSENSTSENASIPKEIKTTKSGNVIIQQGETNIYAENIENINL